MASRPDMQQIIQALSEGAPRYYYAPQTDIHTGRIAGFDLAGIAPNADQPPIDYSDFLQALDQDERILALVERVLHGVSADMVTLAAAGAAALPVIVSIPLAVLANAQFAGRVAAIPSSRGVAPDKLCVGVTEQALSHPDAAHAVHGIRADGVRIVLQDFGTGSASLNLLAAFPLFAVQAGLRLPGHPDHHAAALLAATAAVAHAEGIRLIAKHVDNEERFETVRDCGCDDVQGELLGAQVSSAGLAAYVAEPRRLPAHLTERRKTPRNLLLVDDEANIVSALKRLLRRDSYTILTAGSGQEGLEILANNSVDVIVSDQRMPGMTGVEFLRKAKELCPNSIRMVLSGYSELQSVVAAVNEGAIYKFLMKPWDDVQLREHIAEAFHHKEVEDENRHLQMELKQANSELAASNKRLEEVLALQQQRIHIDEISLDITREALELVPLPVMALDDDNMVAYMNAEARSLYDEGAGLLGSDAAQEMPDLLEAMRCLEAGRAARIALRGRDYELVVRRMGNASHSRGKIVTLIG